MKLTGLYYEEKTGHYLKGYKTGNPSDAEKLRTSLAKELQERCKVEYKESGLQEDNKKEPGKVWLVGAGPGDVGLFTMKGAQVLEQADVVVYDSLVGQESGQNSCFCKTDQCGKTCRPPYYVPGED